MSDWSDEETDDPHYADRRNFYKVEKWCRDGLRVELMLYAGRPTIANFQDDLRMGLWHLTGELHDYRSRIGGGGIGVFPDNAHGSQVWSNACKFDGAHSVSGPSRS